MGTIALTTYQSPVGELLLGDYLGQLCLCDWKYRKMRAAIDDRIQKHFNAAFVEGESDLLDHAKRQLDDYFGGHRRQFDLKLILAGTPFQQNVWKLLQQIPYCSTLSYLQLSQQLGNEKAIRAVAAANGANAISILIPCHRIIGSKGELVGYAGGIVAKKKLLQLEGALPNAGQLSLFG